jgi:[ribosomal protein S5]-alanine N-acetyltransferase
MKILETDRLWLREFVLDDAPFLFTLVNSPGWLKFIGDRGVRTLEDARKYITERLVSSYNTSGFGFYVVLPKDGVIPMGMCGLVKRDTLDDVDIGFAFLSEYSGKGYAHEAASAVIKYGVAKFGLKRIVAITTFDNTSSIKLLGKIGLKFEKTIKFGDDELNLFSINTKT